MLTLVCDPCHLYDKQQGVQGIGPEYCFDLCRSILQHHKNDAAGLNCIMTYHGFDGIGFDPNDKVLSIRLKRIKQIMVLVASIANGCLP